MAQVGTENSPSLLVQLSDLHLREGEGQAGAEARLRHAVLAVAAIEPRPCAVLLSGDLVDVPSSETYERVHELIAPLRLPVHAIPGNHDDRDMLRARFGPQDANAGARVQFAVDCGALRLIGCDSTGPGREAGALGGGALAWLERTLASEPERPTLLALHHPPVATGVRVMDAIGLDADDSARLESLLERHPQVLATTCGHVHSTMTTSFAGRPLLICPSTNSTVRLDLRDRDDLPFATVERPVGFAVHALIDGRLVSHVQTLDRVRDPAG
jgi:3',5'-cyclic-AMP phosphodiesterase